MEGPTTFACKSQTADGQDWYIPCLPLYGQDQCLSECMEIYDVQLEVHMVRGTNFQLIPVNSCLKSSALKGLKVQTCHRDFMLI